MLPWASLKDKDVPMTTIQERTINLVLSVTAYNQMLAYAEKQGMNKWAACRDLIYKGLDAVQEKSN